MIERTITFLNDRTPVVLTTLREADLCGAYLRGADLHGADLRGADLHGANLHGADLRGADLREADLCGAYLRGADLCGADLRVADLRGADLCGADLRGADLRRAYLRGADLREADLETDHKCDGNFIILEGICEWGPLLAYRTERQSIRILIGCRAMSLDEMTAHWVDRKDRKMSRLALEMVRIWAAAL